MMVKKKKKKKKKEDGLQKLLDESKVLSEKFGAIGDELLRVQKQAVKFDGDVSLNRRFEAAMKADKSSWERMSSHSYSEAEKITEIFSTVFRDITPRTTHVCKVRHDADWVEVVSGPDGFGFRPGNRPEWINTTDEILSLLENAKAVGVGLRHIEKLYPGTAKFAEQLERFAGIVLSDKKEPDETCVIRLAFPIVLPPDPSSIDTDDDDKVVEPDFTELPKIVSEIEFTVSKSGDSMTLGIGDDDFEIDGWASDQMKIAYLQLHAQLPMLDLRGTKEEGVVAKLQQAFAKELLLEKL